jgi:activator-of-BECN1-regulated-autophagy protein 1
VAMANAGAGMRVYPNQGIPISRRGGTAGIGAAETAVAQSAMAAAVASAELPCTVKLRIWPHDIKCPSALLDPEMCRLVIPHAVLCSEMGAHFSPCGRFLAACVACVLPAFDAEYSILPATVMGSPNFGTRAHSPTQHPISTQQVIYELRVYSLEEAT